mmetsp:Transcript_35810/g.40829  ORF Transcript_35810/g.40829 Transcript_35810/m.40829 type:complete len:226 (+) Transcript_35810:9-686(+)
MKGTYRPTKRQKREAPINPLDAVGLSQLSSYYGILKTPIIISSEKDIILDRLKKELIIPFELVLSVPRLYNRNATAASKLTQINISKRNKKKVENWKVGIIKSRMWIGINQGTRALEQEQPELVLLCNDVHSSIISQHVIKRIKSPNTTSKVPIIIFPGSRASFELGKIIGINRASLVVFTKQPTGESLKGNIDHNTNEVEIHRYHQKIDSFLEFCKSKVPEDST